MSDPVSSPPPGGANPPGAQYADVVVDRGPGGPQNGIGTAALVMGILQFFCLPLIGSILAIILGWNGMAKAKRGQATNGGTAKAGFWLGIVGAALAVIGIVVAVAVLVVTANAANSALEQANNARTGLTDGNYVMEPTTSLRVNDRCSFGGTPTNLDTGEVAGGRVSVVGAGAVQCAGTGTPDAVVFTVSGGVAAITSVQ